MSNHKERDRMISEEFDMISDGRNRRKKSSKIPDCMDPGFMDFATKPQAQQAYPVWKDDDLNTWPKFDENNSACVELLEKLSDALVTVQESDVLVAVGGYFEKRERLSEAVPAAIYRWLNANKVHPKDIGGQDV